MTYEQRWKIMIILAMLILFLGGVLIGLNIGKLVFWEVVSDLTDCQRKLYE